MATETANVFSLPFPSDAPHFKQLHNSPLRFVIVPKPAGHQAKRHNGSSMPTRTVGGSTTYYYRTIGGVQGSTSSLGSIPSGAIVEARITT